MISISVKIGRITHDRVDIWNTQEKLHGQDVYGVKSQRNKPFIVLHSPVQGLAKLIAHVFSHYAIVERGGETPTKEEDLC